MAFNDDLTWITLSNQAGSYGKSVKDTILNGLEGYNEWQSFRASRTNAQIATALGRTESEVAELDAAFSAIKEIHDFANNVASPTQGDRFFAIRKFS